MFTTLVPAPIYTSGVCKRQFFFIDLLSNFRSTFLLFISSFEYLTPLWSAADVISLERAFLYLHSNMFLLILDTRRYSVSIYSFTFQYVSINTTDTGLSAIFDIDLHSNMFLLIRERSRQRNTARSRFTFQYVSINTQCAINTLCVNIIYIPICFY